MKVAIVTLPLHTNYGGLLQAYALKSIIEDMGHEVTVLDIAEKTTLPSFWKAPFIYLKRLLQGREVFRERRIRREYPIISSKVSVFTENYICPRVISSYSEIAESDFDAYVVGSDQVWRPEYFNEVQDAFLRFARTWDVKRIAYAASFGTEELKYEYQLLEECSQLLSKFDAVSVREASGVAMCDEWFDYEDAVHVLDPVLMLSAEHYSSKFRSGSDAEGKVVTYILDRSASKSNVIDFISEVTGKPVYDVSVYPKDRDIPLQDRIVPSLESWISAFVNAEFVVTDSFHGCVLSILFHKPFVVVGNVARGMTRVNSLLSIFSLESRLVDGIDADGAKEWLMNFDWDAVDAVLERQRNICKTFLMSSLNVDGASDSGQVEM